MKRYVSAILLLALFVGSQCVAVPSDEMSPEAIQEAMERATSTLRGKILWPGQGIPHATVQIFRDSSLKQLYTEGVLLDGEGDFEVRVEPGRYYVVAFVDMNNSGTFDLGDGMGIHGITEWNNQNQERQPVQAKAHETIGDLVIQVSAIMTEVDGVQQIIDVRDPILKQMQGGFSLNLRKLFTGIRGQVEWPEHSLEKTLVFAYTDPSWKYRTGHGIVQPDGSFEIKLPPGKYYLLTVIDENGSGNFDAGDPFGIHGVAEADSDQLPKPVLVEPNRFAEEIQIPIIGVRPEEPSQSQERPTTQLEGKVEWAGHTLVNTEVEVYWDATLTRPVMQIPVDSEGNFEATLPVGSYYLIASVDNDGDGTYSPGDAMGGYGTTDIAGFPPGILLVSEEANDPISIEISARYDSAGQLYSAHSLEGDLPMAPTEIAGSGISGRVLWPDQTVRNVIILLSQTPSFESPLVLMMQLADDGQYAWPVGAGDYYLMAVVDANGNRLADVEDGIGVYGTRNPVSGTPQQVSVFADRVTPYLDIEVHAIYTDLDGAIARIEDAHRSEIRLQYGQPEDLYQFTRFGKVIQEWWYWKQGIGFIFESVGLGWKLSDTKHFDPDEASESNPATSSVTPIDGVVYYGYDRVLWGLAPNGHQEPLALGTHLTANQAGTAVAFLDMDGNVRVATPQKLSGEIVLDRSASAECPVLSPDGRYIVYVRRMAKGSQLHVLHLTTGQIQPVPTAFRECDTPAWSPDGMLIAYAASGHIDQPDSDSTTRNLYLYDIETQRIEPLVIGTEDDAEPVWATDGSKALVFSRAEEGHRQLWRVNINEDGTTSVTQLTRYGGSQPTRVPDGSSILYQNNGQLWLIPVEGQTPQPLRVDGRVVMGTSPFAASSGEQLSEK